MNLEKVDKIIVLLESALAKFEDNKSSVTSAIQILYRAALLANEEDCKKWAEIQLGNYEIEILLDKFSEEFIAQSENNKYDIVKSKSFLDLKNAGVKIPEHLSYEELAVIIDKSSGGVSGIEFIEQRYQCLLKNKKGNDGTYYISNLTKRIGLSRKRGHYWASKLYEKFAFQELPERAFDILRKSVEDKLFTLKPEIAEQLLIAFKAINSNSEEELSQSITTCRRLLVNLADQLYPAREEKVNGRDVKENNYINRIWAYLDENITSSTNKDIAKAHVDLLGAYLQNIFKFTNKGVHSNISKFDAIRIIFHVYLLLADILQYIDIKKLSVGDNNIHTASFAELKKTLNLSDAIISEIIRVRVSHTVTLADLKKIKGIGPQKLELIKTIYAVK